MKPKAILCQIQWDLGGGVSNAIATAHPNVVNTIHQDILERIDDGSLHVEP
jgi:hypothetical protein